MIALNRWRQDVQMLARDTTLPHASHLTALNERGSVVSEAVSASCQT